MRSTSPLDFRQVGLEPGPGPRRAERAALGAGSGAFGLGVLLGGAEPFTVMLAGLAGGLAALLALRGVGPSLAKSGAVTTRMSIVPWGIVVHDEPADRVLRWAAVRSVSVDFVHDMDHATPSTRWSLVRVVTRAEILAGRAPGAVSLEQLEAHVSRYADEAARPVALDLDGSAGIEDPFEPVFEQLLAEARTAVLTGKLTERLSVSPRSYRSPRACTPSEPCGVELCELLQGCSAYPFDPRPLAALVVAELGAPGAREALLSLCNSPHPMVALTARVAALRLGAGLSRAGSPDELADFLPPHELDQARDYLALHGASHPVE
ncbi:MAG: hypothetical protein KF718_15835 [Polyangiaceae bacterium]|nr:hypothetical protein [Polyangiaceae bacterium]